MRTVLILATLTLVAFVSNQKWLGQLVLLFILGCALFRVGEAISDLFNERSTLTAGGRRYALRKHLESLPPNFNPRYGSMRLRGKSHEECVRRGIMPTRPDDYYEQQIEKSMKEMGL